ncbi:MAG: cell division protein FtsZ, partial [Oscillospiraceae bacterium]|nr:cell division protein FtsZ [Oscillospiraceae bacterium]
LKQAVTSISDLIKNTGFINLDFADVTCIMKNAGFAHMGVGHAAGKGKAEDAARMAVASPLMETSINGARGVLINITGSEDMGLEDVEAAANLVQEAAHPDANIIFGATFDPDMQDEIRVTVIATGFEEKTVEGEKPEEKKAAAPVSPVAPVRPVAPARPAVKPAGLFTGAAEKAAATAAVPPPLPEEEETEPAGEDPFDSIFRIFNTK